ncbi:hypothetical protein KR009_005429, partial [Drosophila setifemur]
EAVLFKLTNFVCENHNSSALLIQQCRLKAVRRGKVVLNFVATVLKPVDDLTGRFQVLKKANGYKPWLVDRTLDFCRFLDRPYDPYAIFIYKFAKEFSNVNHSCPLTGSLIVKDFYPRAEAFKLPLPTGDYILSTNWQSHHVTQLVTNISFAFVEDLISG